jgi:hypothetical protein
MKPEHNSVSWIFRTLFIGLLLALAAPVMAQTARNLTKATPLNTQEALSASQFRVQYETIMWNFERLASVQGNASMLANLCPIPKWHRLSATVTSSTLHRHFAMAR